MKGNDRTIALAVAISACAGIVVVLVPGRASVVGHVWLVLIFAIGLGATVRALLLSVPSRPSAFDNAFAPRRRTRARPTSLEHAERVVTLATGTAFDVHYRLRPSVRDVASGLLARRGIELDRSGRAESLLSPELWELVRPERPVPEDRTAPGLPLERLESVVDELELLS